MRARDSRGRWVRSTVAAEENSQEALKEAPQVVPEEAADQEFVFDDRVIDNSQPAGAKQLSLGLNDVENAPESWTAAADDSPPLILAPMEANLDPLSPADVFQQDAAPISVIYRYRFFMLLGVVLLLGVVFFGFQRGYFSSKRADVITPPLPQKTVAPEVVPSASKQTVRRPPARAVVALPLIKEKNDRKVTAAVVIHPAPAPALAPAVPSPAAPVVPAPLPSPHPDPPSSAAGESVPSFATSQTISDEEGWFNLAEEYLQMGDEERAEALYRRILKEGAQQGRAALALGDLFAKQNDFNSAQEFYRISKQLFQGRVQPTSTP